MSSLLYINKKNCLWPREESCLARWELNLCHVPILSVHLPCLLYVEDKYGRLTFFFFFRAMVLNRDPKVKSPWFETRSGKNSATSQLLGSSARKFRRWSFTCVNEEVNWTPFCNELCFLNPFAQLLDCRSIVVFFNLPIGVSARNHGTWRSPKKMMIFWVRGPAPFFNCSNFFSSRLIPVGRSLRPRVSAKFWANIGAWLWSVTILIPFGTQLNRVRMPAENRMGL